MKALVIAVVLLSSTAFGCPTARLDACEIQKKLRQEMDRIGLNIANANTTPNFDLMKEMQDMLAASKKHDEAKVACLAAGGHD